MVVTQAQADLHPCTVKLPPLGLGMPNGDRRPFRIGEGRPRSPSPAHTSDSEDTRGHKRRYHRFQVEGILRWRSLTIRARRERGFTVVLLVNRLAAGCACVAERIVRFLHGTRAQRYLEGRNIDQLRDH